MDSAAREWHHGGALARLEALANGFGCRVRSGVGGGALDSHFTPRTMTLESRRHR